MNLSPANLFIYTGLLAAGATLAPARIRFAALTLALILAYPLSWALTGLLGALSFTTGILAWGAALHRLVPHRIRIRPEMTPASAGLLLTMGLIVLLSSVGPIKANIYHGFGDDRPGAVAALVWLTALPSAFPLRGYAIAIPLAALLTPWRWHDSTNAWDLFVDPLLLGYAAFVIGSSACARFRRRPPVTP